MKSEFYVVRIEYPGAPEVERYKYLKHIYAYHYSTDGVERLYLTMANEIIKGKQYSHYKQTQRAVDRLNSWYAKKEYGECPPELRPTAKALKVELEINAEEV